MNLDKSQKRIAKKVKRGFQGYPLLSINYYGPTNELATKVAIGFVLEEGAEPMFEKFSTQQDIRQDSVIQSAIVKIMERSNAQTVTLTEEIQGCAHEEGSDYPAGSQCTQCDYWRSNKRK